MFESKRQFQLVNLLRHCLAFSNIEQAEGLGISSLFLELFTRTSLGSYRYRRSNFPVAVQTEFAARSFKLVKWNPFGTNYPAILRNILPLGKITSLSPVFPIRSQILHSRYSFSKTNILFELSGS